METNGISNPSEITDLIRVQRQILSKLNTISGWVTFLGIITIVGIGLALLGLLLGVSSF